MENNELENKNNPTEIEEEYNPEELLTSIKEKNIKRIKEIFENFNLIDIAETLNTLDSIEEFVFVFKVVPPEYTADVYTYLDPDLQEDIVTALTSDQLAKVISYVYSDDIVDSIQELPANLTSKIIAATPASKRAEINQLLSYKEDSTGSIMSTEYIMLKETDTAETAIKTIRKEVKKAETISYLFVVDKKRILLGTITLKEILKMDEDQTIGDVMETDFVSVFANSDQEEAANTFKQYDLNAIPVTTSDNRLVGMITSDDIIDVIEEEATEDIQLMANVNPLEDSYAKTNAWQLAKRSAGWLVLLMLLGTFTSFIMNRFEDAMLVVPCLSIFIPMLIDTAGNAGNQSSAVIIRALGLGEITPKDYFKVLGKEILSALMVGATVAIVNCLWIYFLGSVHIIDLEASAIHPLMLGALVGTAMFVCILFSKFIGTTLPIVVKLCKIDPAMLAGPMVTTLVDASSLLIYFFIAAQIFRII